MIRITPQERITHQLTVIGVETLTCLGSTVLCGGNIAEGKGSLTSTLVSGALAIGTLLDTRRRVDIVSELSEGYIDTTATEVSNSLQQPRLIEPDSPDQN